MARSLGIGAMPWSPLANGVLTGKYADRRDPEPDRGAFVDAKLTERNAAIVDVLVDVAGQIASTGRRAPDAFTGYYPVPSG